MNFKRFATTAFLSVGMAALPVSVMAATPKACVPGKPTPASYTWNFNREASQLLDGIQQDASSVANHAARLQSFFDDPYLSWHAHGTQLTSVKQEINDMGGKLCRLEQIRRVVSPWERAAIDRTAPSLRLMADNASDAIAFLNLHKSDFWMPAYQKNINNLYQEASSVSHAVKNFEEYAKAHREDMQLRKELGLKANS